MNKPINIAIADDHPTLISGLKMCLQSDEIHVVGTTTDISEVCDLYFKSQPDVLILDISFGSMPAKNPQGLSGLDMINTIINRDKDAKIIIFSQYDDIQLVEKCYNFGAVGFLPKSSDTSELLNSILTVVNNEVYFSEETAKLLARRHLNKSSEPAFDELNEIEINILKLKSLGKTEIEIANEIKVSKSTITKKIRELKDKFSVDSLSELIEIAHKKNIFNDTSW